MTVDRIFRLLRVSGRLAAMGAATACIYCWWILGRTISGRKQSERVRLRSAVVRAWARALASLFRMRIEVRGTPPVRPFFLVSNHLSYIDIIALATILECTFVAKSDIAGWPVVGALARSVNTIFIDRTSFQDIPRVIGLIEQTMAEGSGIVLFPEGTSTSGAGVLPFSPALLEPAARARLPVHYAAISYRTPQDEPPAHIAICWWGDMTFVPHFIGALGLKRFEAFIDFGEQPIVEGNRKELARKLRTAVAERFEPFASLEDECLAKEN